MPNIHSRPYPSINNRWTGSHFDGKDEMQILCVKNTLVEVEAVSDKIIKLIRLINDVRTVMNIGTYDLDATTTYYLKINSIIPKHLLIMPISYVRKMISQIEDYLIDDYAAKLFVSDIDVRNLIDQLRLDIKEIDQAVVIIEETIKKDEKYR